MIAEPADDKTQFELQFEASKYGDMIQFGFRDAYYNLTLKTIAVLRWISINCLKSTYVMKADDDLIVNINLLLEKLTTFKSGITGRVLTGLHPNRDVLNKQFVPESIYPNSTYPGFATGSAYIMKTRVIQSLIKTIDKYPGLVIDIEDVFMTGIIAEMAHIPRYDSKLFYNTYYCPNDVCLMFDYIILHGCETADEVLQFWSNWKQYTPHSCNTFILTITLLIVIIVLIILGVVLGVWLSIYRKNRDKSSKSTVEGIQLTEKNVNWSQKVK